MKADQAGLAAVHAAHAVHAHLLAQRDDLVGAQPQQRHEQLRRRVQGLRQGPEKTRGVERAACSRPSHMITGTGMSCRCCPAALSTHPVQRFHGAQEGQGGGGVGAQVVLQRAGETKGRCCIRELAGWQPQGRRRASVQPAAGKTPLGSPKVGMAPCLPCSGILPRWWRRCQLHEQSVGGMAAAAQAYVMIDWCGRGGCAPQPSQAAPCSCSMRITPLPATCPPTHPRRSTTHPPTPAHLQSWRPGRAAAGCGGAAGHGSGRGAAPQGARAGKRRRCMQGPGGPSSGGPPPDCHGPFDGHPAWFPALRCSCVNAPLPCPPWPCSVGGPPWMR